MFRTRQLVTSSYMTGGLRWKVLVVLAAIGATLVLWAPAAGAAWTGYDDTNGNLGAGPSPFGALTTGQENTVLAIDGMSSDSTGSFNVATGSPMGLNTTGDWNVAYGWDALGLNEEGSNNVATGGSALYFNT